MKLSIFCPFGLKTPIHTPKIGVFGGFHPENGEQCHRNPQKAHPCASPFVLCHSDYAKDQIRIQWPCCCCLCVRVCVMSSGVYCSPSGCVVVDYIGLHTPQHNNWRTGRTTYSTSHYTHTHTTTT